MTSVLGSKSIFITACLLLTTFALLASAMIAKRKTRIKYYEKKYTEVLSSLEASNKKICKDFKVPFIDETN